MTRFASFWREPLLHFLVIGAGLFLVFSASRQDEPQAAHRIVVDAGQIQQLVARFERTWLRQPTEQELQHLVENHVREEIYYREALALGLDRDDPQVRQRMRMKLEYLLDDLASGEPPDDSVLADYLQHNAEDFQLPPRTSFQQVYLNPERHPDAQAEAASVLQRLQSGQAADQLGDPTVQPHQVPLQTQEEIARTFGDVFARQVIGLPEGRWVGPVPSAMGLHLVRVTGHEPGRLPALQEIRPLVQREVLAWRRERARDAAYARLRQRYEVVVETPPGSRDTVAVEAMNTSRDRLR
jgi:hypothetical protein